MPANTIAVLGSIASALTCFPSSVRRVSLQRPMTPGYLSKPPGPGRRVTTLQRDDQRMAAHVGYLQLNHLSPWAGSAGWPDWEQPFLGWAAREGYPIDVVTNAVPLATLLATLPEPLRDDARAAELLESIADASAPGIGRFAALLSSHVLERRRLGREAERVAREHAASDKERDKREEALRQQLDALRAIERGILEREERLRRRPN